MEYSHYHFVIIIYFLITPLTYIAMENKKIHTIFSEINEITTVEEPIRARLLPDHRIIIVNKEGSTYIVDPKIQQPQKINSFPFQQNSLIFPIIQNNKDKIISCKDNTVIINDAKTGKRIWNTQEQERISSLAWSPLNNTIFLSYFPINNNIKEYNYVTRNYKTIATSKPHCHLIAMHPKEKIICIADMHGNISLHELNNTLSIIKRVDLSEDFKKVLCNFCQYNSDGSYIAVGHNKKIIILDQNKTLNKYPCLQPQKYESFQEIAFHPSSSILAILYAHIEKLTNKITYTKQFVRYYDIKILQCIGQTIEFYSADSHDLAFSQDGYNIIITLDDKCVKLPVFFAIKEKYLYSLCVLNQFKYNNEQNLPQDVAQYILNILLKSIVYD